MSMADKLLVCRDCGLEFVFTAGEQEFYAARGFNDPTRCPTCRAARRQMRGSGPSASASGLGMGDSRPTRQLYPAICAQCGRETMVPFEPRNGRPVYCRECFQRLQGR